MSSGSLYLSLKSEHRRPWAPSVAGPLVLPGANIEPSEKEIATGLIGRSWLAKERIEAAAHAKSWRPVGALPVAAHEESEAVVGQDRGLNQIGSHRWDRR